MAEDRALIQKGEKFRNAPFDFLACALLRALLLVSPPVRPGLLASGFAVVALRLFSFPVRGRGTLFVLGAWPGTRRQGAPRSLSTTGVGPSRAGAPSPKLDSALAHAISEMRGSSLRLTLSRLEIFLHTKGVKVETLPRRRVSLRRSRGSAVLTAGPFHMYFLFALSLFFNRDPGAPPPWRAAGRGRHRQRFYAHPAGGMIACDHVQRGAAARTTPSVVEPTPGKRRAT